MRAPRVQSLVHGIRPYLLLALVVLVVALPGLESLPVMDRDEARIVQATRQMAETGDAVAVRFQDQVRADKPVGIHWLQAAMVELVSHPADTRAWPYRLPSVLGVLLAVLFTFRLGTALFDRRIALVAAGILATALVVVVEAHLAKADAMLLGLTSVAVSCLGMIYMQGKGGTAAPRWVPLVFWLALGCGILVKGPIAPMVVILTGLALAVADRSYGWLNALRPVMGVIIAAAVVLPWIMAASEYTDGTFIGAAVRDELLPQVLGESDVRPPGYHALFATLLLWPASLFLWPALARAWRERALPGVRFALAWLGPSWIVFELIPTKLPHYTLPLYPAIALLIAVTLFAVRDGTYERLARLPARLWYVVWGAVGLVLAGSIIAFSSMYGGGVSLWSLLAAASAVGAVAGGLWHALRRRYLNALAAGMAGAVVLHVSMFAGVLPGMSDLWISQRMAQAADAHAPGQVVVSAGYHEPSLVFLMGTNTILSDGTAAAAALASGRAGAAAIESRAELAFQAAVAEQDLTVRPVAVVDGLNYSRGQPVRMTLYVPD